MKKNRIVQKSYCLGTNSQKSFVMAHGVVVSDNDNIGCVWIICELGPACSATFGNHIKYCILSSLQDNEVVCQS